ncbi:FAD-dependent oxidoreductase [Variovorax sp. PBL-E5]|uniref:FAD-dependent oxidoreductase n=1 Tax=Variovorax sp. PBL-E5 TaxID=434014 RepID=UPI00131817CF|nr:FAD-dependent oxidoreductase [Variovorax sp. PBL-E5]VTU38631.1 putative FAD-binding dehydrogenase [Variovorax sp. PBL-E5]
MLDITREIECDVLVIGGGAAGVAAATCAARNGAKTILVEASPMVGGELVSGISMLGMVSTRGEWIVGGIARDLLREVEALDGYIGPVFDYRSLHLVCYDPELMKFAVVGLLDKAGVELMLYTLATGVLSVDGQVRGVFVQNKSGRHLVRAKVVIDASGDADLVDAAGGKTELGKDGRFFQPPSLIFRMIGVDTPRLLGNVLAHPEDYGLAEFPGLGMTREQCAQALVKQGQPKIVLLGDRGLLKRAIEDKEMFPTSIVAVIPVSVARSEVSINCTQIGNVDATETKQLSAAIPTFFSQIQTSMRFLKARVPGFESAHFSGVAGKIGVRETRRIVGDYVLTEDDVLQARKRADVVAKGGHEIDLFAVSSHRRQTIKDGGSYDIPLSVAIAQNVRNLFVVGRCLSATREAQSSARVMGTCMAMGQAAGTAAAMCAGDPGWTGDVRSAPIPALQERLIAQGALLESEA